LLPCLFKKYFGFPCPGCGLQRSFWLLLDGKFSESLTMYPALIPVMVTFLMTVVYLWTRKKMFLKALMLSFYVATATIVISFTVKAINQTKELIELKENGK